MMKFRILDVNLEGQTTVPWYLIGIFNFDFDFLRNLHPGLERVPAGDVCALLRP